MTIMGRSIMLPRKRASHSTRIQAARPPRMDGERKGTTMASRTSATSRTISISKWQ